MSEINHPILEKKKIIKAVVIALSIAVVLLATAVLPAEYGLDPIGTGKLLGFSRLHITDKNTEAQGPSITSNQISFPLLKLENIGSKPDVPKPIEANNPPPKKQYEMREDSISILVPAGEGLEYKVLLLKHGSMKYEWIADSSFLFFDFHGEVKEENRGKAVFFESYTISNAKNVTGTFLAPFEGKHGWYFKNKGSKDVTVSLRLKGEYILLNKS
ncbi:MAG: hypothetical protein ABIP35_09110 [Ginsengibacter sp.]